jgi:septal ring factor EnvC (AmiA/AmiB activator)
MIDITKLENSLRLSEKKRADLAHTHNKLQEDHATLQRQYFKLQDNFETLLKHKMKEFVHTLYDENKTL